jgi:hypothetical protein
MTESNTPLTLIIQDVRLARVSLIRPYIGKDAKIDPTTGKPTGKYHSDIIVSTTHPQLARVKELMRAAAVRKWKSDAEQVLTQIAAQDKLALHRGDITRAGKPEFAGMLYISSSNSVQPNIVVSENGINLSTLDGSLNPGNPAYPYAGCRANVIVDFWAYEHPTGGKGISSTLLGVQFLRHDVRLAGSSVASTNEFSLVPGEADGAAPSAVAVAGGNGLI